MGDTTWVFFSTIFLRRLICGPRGVSAYLRTYQHMLLKRQYIAFFDKLYLLLTCFTWPRGVSAYLRTYPHMLLKRRYRGSLLAAGLVSAYVSILQHTSAYVSIRQHTSAYLYSLRGLCWWRWRRQLLWGLLKWSLNATHRIPPLSLSHSLSLSLSALSALPPRA